jgi:uncharacterized protein (DUF433 family)
MIDRITIEPGKRSDQPCIRGLRITVWDVLGWLAAGVTQEQILEDYPDLEPQDFPAVFAYALRVGKSEKMADLLGPAVH